MIGRIFRRLPAALLALVTVLSAPAIAQEADRYAFTQDYDPAPAMWRLADEDTTIYMLGTIHLLPEGFRWRNPQLDAIVDEAEVLVVETRDEDGQADIAAISPKLLHLMAGRAPTSQQLSRAARPRWRELVALTGLPFDYVDNMPVMLALMSFGQADAVGDPSSYDYGVETVLEREFEQSGRPIQSIEDFGRVMYGMFRVDDARIVAELEQQLLAWEGKSVDGFYDPAIEDLTGDAYWEMEHTWARGELNEDFDLGFGEGAIGQAFNEVLLNHRNGQWAMWLEDRLEQPGTILLAVGAGHFEGPDSVLVKLEALGLEAERIN